MKRAVDSTLASTKRLRQIDAFDTKPAIASACLAHLRDATSALAAPHTIVEPSAGLGNFVRAIQDSAWRDTRVIAFDKYRGVPDLVETGIDFLQWDPSTIDAPVWVIGNPPFGVNGADAFAFFNRAATFANVIAFVVPKSFRKDAARRAHEAFTLCGETELPWQSFDLGDTTYGVSTYWQVWRRRTEGEARTTAIAAVSAGSDIHALVSRLTDEEMGVLASQPERAAAQMDEWSAFIVARANVRPGYVVDPSDHAKVQSIVCQIRRPSPTAKYRVENWFFFRTSGTDASENRLRLARALGASSVACNAGSRGNISVERCFESFDRVLLGDRRE